jgi:hypothetical protein
MAFHDAFQGTYFIQEILPSLADTRLRSRATARNVEDCRWIAERPGDSKTGGGPQHRWGEEAAPASADAAQYHQTLKFRPARSIHPLS